MGIKFNSELVKLIMKETGLKEECSITEINIESKLGLTKLEIAFNLYDEPGGPK